MQRRGLYQFFMKGMGQIADLRNWFSNTSLNEKDQNGMNIEFFSLTILHVFFVTATLFTGKGTCNTFSGACAALRGRIFELKYRFLNFSQE